MHFQLHLQQSIHYKHHNLKYISSMASTNHVQIAIPRENIDIPTVLEQEFDYSQRAQWLRAAVLGANDGLITISSLIMGIGAFKNDAKAMILTGFAGLFAGACSMAIGEFVSVYSQLDIEVAHSKRTGEESGEKDENLPNPLQAAMASALAFTLGAIVPLMAAFVGDYKVRMAVVVALTTLALVVFGSVGAVLGGTKVVRSCGRVLVGGWLAMGITFGVSKLLSSSGLEM